jgi:hypothetical protein
MSEPGWLTLIVSLGGLIVEVLFWKDLASDSEEQVGPGRLILTLLPAVLGVVVSTLPMRKPNRIMLYWLTAVIMSMVGAFTLSGGIGIYYIGAVILFFVAAWMENESGEPTRLPLRGDITTNPRRRSRA